MITSMCDMVDNVEMSALNFNQCNFVVKKGAQNIQ